MLRKVRDREEASRYLESAEASGLPRADWARRHGIDARSLNAWRLILARGRQTPRLVELIPRAAPSLSLLDAAGEGFVSLEVRPDGTQGLFLSDAAYTTRVALGVKADGSPVLSMHDAAGNVGNVMKTREP